MGRCFGRRQNSANSRFNKKRRPPFNYKAASSQGQGKGNLERNPFWLFLAQYRKNNKDAQCRLQIPIIAEKMWKGMTLEEKAPFREAARIANCVQIKKPSRGEHGADQTSQ